MRDIYIVVGLGFGDEGKGTIVDYLTRTYNVKTIIRFNGGPQAAHYVVTPEGIEHCCSHFGSGVLAGAETFLSKFMFVEPYALENEIISLEKSLGQFPKIYIDPRCPIVTPYHKYIGQMVELSKGDSRHGSVGLGVGQAVFDAKKKGGDTLVIGDVYDYHSTISKLQQIKEEVISRAVEFVRNCPSNEKLKKPLEIIRNLDPAMITKDYRVFVATRKYVVALSFENEMMSSVKPIIFEGAQGALIDFEGGFWPFVTKSKTTTANAESFLRNYNYYRINKIGVLRAYDHRHGPGPFPTEDKDLKEHLIEKHNMKNIWQGSFRVGWFDAIMSRYAIRLNGTIDSIAITNLDKLSTLSEIFICNQYEYTGLDTQLLYEFFEWVKYDGTTYITKIKKPRNQERQAVLTYLLLECKPIYTYCLEGWNKNISEITISEDLPHMAWKYVTTLQKLLTIPIRIISKGDTWLDKLEFKW